MSEVLYPFRFFSAPNVEKEIMFNGAELSGIVYI